MRFFVIAVLMLVGCLSAARSSANLGALAANPASAVEPEVAPGGALVAQAFAQRKSNVQVTGSGVVSRVLPDDNEGSRHQRFILTIAPGQTLLIAHNIDLAPRVAGLREGDIVSFNGEYEWNAKGGVVHWTHRDPSGRHPTGWLQHNRVTYQ